jgi:nucleotide-binding universal stress UspA family protein
MAVEVSAMSATTALGALAVLWAGVGLLLALVMGRNGHDPFAWWLLGTLLGPLALPLAISAQRRRRDRAWLVRSGRPGRGPVDVLVGLDGSAEALPRLAAEGGYDLLAVGSRAAGLSKVLLGSTATTLAVHAKVSVLVGGGTSSPAWRG